MIEKDLTPLASLALNEPFQTQSIQKSINNRPITVLTQWCQKGTKIANRLALLHVSFEIQSPIKMPNVWLVVEHVLLSNRRIFYQMIFSCSPYLVSVFLIPSLFSLSSDMPRYPRRDGAPKVENLLCCLNLTQICQWLTVNQFMLTQLCQVLTMTVV